MSYARLLRFILPLAITAIVMELGSQVLNGGMARIPQATTTLAAFGVAWGLVLFLAAPLVHSDPLSSLLFDGFQLVKHNDLMLHPRSAREQSFSYPTNIHRTKDYLLQ